MRFKYLFLMVAVLMVAALACDDGDPPPGSGAVLFEDDFADDGGGWDTTTTAGYSLTISNGEYVVTATEPAFYLSSVAGEFLWDMHIETTIRNVGEATDHAFGVICNYQDTNNHYFLGIGADGYYAIVLVQDGVTQRLSSDEDVWVFSDDIPQNASSYQLGADCADGRLALYVNGEEIAAVNDSTFVSGDVGVFVATFEQGNAEVRFDNFVVTEW
jgi:hypothetical protein